MMHVRANSEGYQAALDDIADKLVTEGADGVYRWLIDNLADARRRRLIELERDAARRSELESLPQGAAAGGRLVQYCTTCWLDRRPPRSRPGCPCCEAGHPGGHRTDPGRKAPWRYAGALSYPPESEPAQTPPS
jgi:hypothetical protein